MTVIIRWRFVAASAIVAMAVSLLSGGLRRIQLGTLMIRASIGAAVFTVLAIGINLLIVNLFPEFFDKASPEKYNDDDGSPGSLVDVTLPPEKPESSEFVDDLADGDIGQVAAQVSEDVASINEPDQFSESFPDADEIRSGSPDDESSGLGRERDPEELAQAIHTVITRDEKD
ncbi:hypothetical protein S1OALGB6SA_429 [Olavius algarvensis spirochete endosymbiont]|uniref:hypothetical protein n=1 Tax=Olavius algarvensis spirochete endosymbiont TaxID=260710 RepID=UPI000F2AB081|nr:hypothetical protein [Olavius algarvensis spirochete endosymbiont]VDA99361.1 hypothetical protein S1OALGB6SA_429 [Olavius algarvensis spirochete endosymbiont]